MLKITVINRRYSLGSLTADLNGMLYHGSNARGRTTDYGKDTDLLTLKLPANCNSGSVCTCTHVPVTASVTCDPTPVCNGSIPSCYVTVRNLAPGDWLHKISVGTTGQFQYQHTLVVVDSKNPASVDWTAFATVFVVDQANGTGTGTLRDAVAKASYTSVTAPSLIQFAFPGGIAAITDTQDSAMAITKETVIDGTNVQGNPSPLADFAQRVYPTQITINPTTKSMAYAGDIDINAQNVKLVGLSLKRVLGADAQIVGADQNLVVPGANSSGSRITTCRLDGGAADRTYANGAEGGMTVAAQGKDCVDANNTGGTSSNPFVVENSELRFCYDRGVKSKSGYVKVLNSWVHNNLRGGLFAQVPPPSPTPGYGIIGVIEGVGNLLEQNGRNCPNGTDPNFSGDPTNCGSQGVARTDASEMAVQAGGLAKLVTNGNVARQGVMTGIFLEDKAEADIKNDYLCGGDEKGIWIRNQTGTAPIKVRGIAAVYNAVAGATTDMAVAPDFGADTGLNAGRSSFTHNGGGPNTLSKNLQNAGTALPMVNALGNEWERCYVSGQSDKNVCTKSEVNKDIKNPSVVNYTTSATGTTCTVSDGCWPQRADTNRLQTTIDPGGVAPLKALAGGIVTITGTGFNAIDGHAGYTGADCRALKGSSTNHCTPQVQGTCVEFLNPVTNKWVEAMDILGVTPTSIVVKSPIDCSGPAKIHVRRLGANGAEIVNPPEAAFCVNPTN
jgi:hypothetical protein